MLLASVVQASQDIASTSRRLQKTARLAELLKQLRGDEIEVVVAWLSGVARQGSIGVGYATIRAASALAADSMSLEIMEVDRVLSELQVVRGPGSENRKRELLHAMFARATEPEQRFIIGVIGGELRQGALEGLMLDTIASASGISPDAVRRAAMMAGTIPPVARAALEQGALGLARFEIQLFRPVQPMLAQTAETISNAIDDLGEASLEYKFDGARIQAHKAGDEVRIYSRGMNDVALAIPEVVQAVRALPFRDAILDGEAISLDADGRPLPFQVSMRRFSRKTNFEEGPPMTPFWFDVLYADGASLIDEAQSRRFEILSGAAPPLNIVPHLRTSNAVAAEEFVSQALEMGHEGVMAKQPGAPYLAGARGQSWLKVKQARTLDLVILAAEWGNGRRQGFLSNLHLGARDVEKGGFAMLGKTFKGLTDELLAWQTREFQKVAIGSDKYTVYLEPNFVAEIAFNEIQVSSRYKSGLALRFARVKRYRSDKTAEEADTFQTVQKLAGIR